MRIHLKGFKSLKNAQVISIGRKITFLVGPNSAGKSSVMLALDRLRGESTAFSLNESLVYRNPNKDSEIVAVHSLGMEWKYKREQLVCHSSYCSEEKFREMFFTANHFALHLNEEVTNSDDDFSEGSARLFTSYYLNQKHVLTIGGSSAPRDFKDLANARKISYLERLLVYKGVETIIINYDDIDEK